VPTRQRNSALQYLNFRDDLQLVSRYTFSALPAIGVGIAALCSERAVRWVATPAFVLIAIYSLTALAAGRHLGVA
jgi:hypothetical protein